MNEDDLLRAGGRAALYALGASADDFHPDRRPVVLVHGINGAPADLQAVVDRIWSLPVQLYVLAYDDYERRTSYNGDDLAEELRALARSVSAGTDLTFISHSMGGIVTRWAVNRLALEAPEILGRFRRIWFLGVDVPWHGYSGPADGWMMDLARPFMPDGLEDMRAQSGEFQGIPDHADPVRRAGLYGVPLPSNLGLTVVFAQNGDEVYDYTEDVLAELPAKLVALYRDGTPVGGDPLLVNFWKALRSSDQVARLDQTLGAMAAAWTLDAAAARAVLEQLFPRFPGDHTTVLHEHPGERTVLDLVQERLAAP
jgi:pimeloyl-ACP methyl ester carboxylesterase